MEDTGGTYRSGKTDDYFADGFNRACISDGAVYLCVAESL